MFYFPFKITKCIFLTRQAKTDSEDEEESSGDKDDKNSKAKEKEKEKEEEKKPEKKTKICTLLWVKHVLIGYQAITAYVTGLPSFTLSYLGTNLSF